MTDKLNRLMQCLITASSFLIVTALLMGRALSPHQSVPGIVFYAVAATGELVIGLHVTTIIARIK